MRKLLLLGVAALASLTMITPAGASATAAKKVTVTFNGNCTATFQANKNGMVHERRDDPDCPIAAADTSTGESYQSMHVIFRPTRTHGVASCPTGGLFYQASNWTAGTDPVLTPIFGTGSYTACYYPQIGDLLDTVTVDAGIYAQVPSAALPAGGNYSFVSSGTWKNGCGGQGLVCRFETHDTAYQTWDDWLTYEPAPTLFVDGEQQDWGVYDPSHVYTLAVTGTGGVHRFLAPDEPGQDYYSDNLGVLTVAIFYAGPI